MLSQKVFKKYCKYKNDKAVLDYCGMILISKQAYAIISLKNHPNHKCKVLFARQTSFMKECNKCHRT